MIAEVGDRVRFLDEKGEGIITRINGELAYVLIEEGFEIPAKVSQLVVIEKAKENKSQHTPIIHDNGLKNYNYVEREEFFEMDESFKPIAEHFIPDDNITNDIYLAYVCYTVKNIDKYALYLINDANTYFTFCLFFKTQDGYVFIDNGNLEPNTKILVSELTKEELININKILVQAILFSTISKEKGKIFEKELKNQTLYLLNNQYYKENDFFDEPAFLISLMSSESSIEKIKSEKIINDINQQQPIEFKKEENLEILEVDLHIHELVEETSNLTASQMLNIQINHFRKKMEEAILNSKIKKVVFIHGVGNGTLKLELRRILNREYAHYDYQDASYKEYGFGATMVILRS